MDCSKMWWIIDHALCLYAPYPPPPLLILSWGETVQKSYRRSLCSPWSIVLLPLYSSIFVSNPLMAAVWWNLTDSAVVRLFRSVLAVCVQMVCLRHVCGVSIIISVEARDSLLVTKKAIPARPFQSTLMALNYLKCTVCLCVSAYICIHVCANFHFQTLYTVNEIEIRNITREHFQRIITELSIRYSPPQMSSLHAPYLAKRQLMIQCHLESAVLFQM